MTIQSILQKVPLFSLLSTEMLRELVQKGETLSFAPHDMVCHEGDVTSTMYVILDGRVRVFKNDGAGHDVEIATLQTGEFFGEMSLLDNEPRSASVACVTACHLFALAREAFMELLFNAESATISYSIFTALVKRIRTTTERYFEEELTQRIVKAEMEAERHRSISKWWRAWRTN